MNNFAQFQPKLSDCNWQIISSVQQLNKSTRERFFNQADTPFNRYEFLLALESSDSVDSDSGWRSHHFLLSYQDEPLGLMICYAKDHSYGEYVFDWSWADAYHRNGIRYYPKLLMAIPFTPVPCKKWLSASNIGEFEALQSLKQFVTQNDWSGIHLLYPTQTDLATCQESQLIFREGHQFHWFNKTVKEQQPFENFGHFLEQMTARKRKTIKKERAHVQSQGIEFRWLMGNEIDENTLQQFYQFYQLTYAKRRMQGYLTLSFFRQIFCSMPDAVRLLVCQRDGQTLATALYFVDDTCLYGRYWGARDDFHLLHFEACYYQGIEYCIRHKLKHFNPGTQGEHKIARGFKPVLTHSLHHLFLAPFQQAIEQFCQEEAEHNALYMKECEQRLPFKQHNE